MGSHFSQEKPTTIQELFNQIAPRYDFANSLLSAGMDTFWRRYVARQVARWKPKTVLDVATGTGGLAEEIKRRIPNCRVFGADFCIPMLLRAQNRGLVDLVVSDGLALPFDNATFDVVTVAFGIRNMASIKDALEEMHRLLRPGGHGLVLDFSLPAPPLQSPYRFYLHHILPKVAGFVTGRPEAYEYFGDSIETFPKGSVMLERFASAGFDNRTAALLSFGIVTVYTGQKLG
ncbi:MAG: ubiquinone/menaquinone biosynthesis methyltransferase [Verrucomicrobia bacterium]|nr:ubiquinone/menaquinone biosynthesis methyltransferase [Verrucomicrobiota bacterium]